MPEHVVYAVDENYWMPLYVSIFSLLDNNEDLSLRIFVLYAERDDDFFEDVERLEDAHDDVTIEGIRVDESQFGDAPTPHWFTDATLYRFLIGTVLPLDDENVLYLDCDTIVDGSLAELFARDIDDSVAAALPEYKLRSFELGLSLDALFYNAGVMYINLGLWKDHDIGARAMHRIETARDVDFPVQEVLNPILNDLDLWTELHPKYNAMTNWVDVLESEPHERPVVIHFTGRDNPWEYTTERPYKDLWWEYLERTPYRGYQPPDETLVHRLIKTRRTLASRSKQSVYRSLQRYPVIRNAVTKLYKLVTG